MSNYHRGVAYVDSIRVEYLYLEDSESAGKISADWTKVFKGGKIIFYPPQYPKVSNVQELGFSKDPITSLTQRVSHKGYLALTDPNQINYMQQMYPDWLKVITQNEVRLYPSVKLK